MAWFQLSRFLSANSGEAERADGAEQHDARVREVFGLSRWFSGVGAASAEARAFQESAESHRRVREALDALPLTMFEFDRNGKYVCAGGRYLGRFGVTPAHVVGRSVFDFPKLVPGKNLMVKRALAGESVVFSGIWPLGRFMIRLQPRFDAQGQVSSVVGLGYDLSRSVDADEQINQLLQALRESEARFRAMCESAPLGIYVSNSAFELGYVNPALCDLLGRSSDELLGKPWRTVLSVEPAPEHALGVSPADSARSDMSEGTFQLVRPDGSRVWAVLRSAQLRDGVEILGHVGVLTDVTREREAREAIDRAQRDLRHVIETSPEGIAVVRDGRWIFINRAMAEALGYARAESLIGESTSGIVHPDDRPLARELAEKRGTVDDRVHELRCRKANGDYALMEIRTAPLTEFDGAPAALITARDVTERKRLQAQLLVTERLLSVGTIAAGVAHEINNPLAAALSNLEWVGERLAKVVEAAGDAGPASMAALRAELVRLTKPLGEAREAAERVRGIVRDLKLFSRAEEDRRGAVDLTPVLDSAARMAWHEVRQRARFVREYGDLPTVDGNDARLGQVFLNLLINAAQAIPEGHADAHEIRLSAFSDAQRVVVEVSDTGAGIPATILARIFDPFFTTKPPGIGTGLGLAICHRIVTSLDGNIEVESQPGKGSVFRVSLRRARPEVEMHVPRVPVQTTPPAMRGRVLVIDDDPAMGNAIGLVLSEDHEVEVFTSARRALERLVKGERYDAIVCDVMMPEMSGMDFHAELSNLEPERAAAVIFLTGGAFTVRAREFLDRVPNPRLDKPFDSESLRALISRQLSREP